MGWVEGVGVEGGGGKGGTGGQVERPAAKEVHMAQRQPGHKRRPSMTPVQQVRVTRRRSSAPAAEEAQMTQRRQGHTGPSQQQSSKSE